MRVILAVIVGVIVEILVSLLSLFVPWIGDQIKHQQAITVSGFFAQYDGPHQIVSAIISNPNPLFLAGQIVVVIAILYTLLARRSSGRMQSAAGYGVHGSSTWGTTAEIRPTEAILTAASTIQSEIEHSLAITERVRA